MSSFNLTPDQAASCRVLPGRALLKVLPAETKVGSLFMPEDAADREMQRQPARLGVVVRVNRKEARVSELRTRLSLGELLALKPGTKVWYHTHADEVDNQYVVVLWGQILAVAVD